MSTYMMRQIDNDLMRGVKARAIDDAISVRSLLIWLMRLYLRHGLTAFEAIGGKFPR